MIAISKRPTVRNWGTISFASTLYLCPILDLLLAEIPEEIRPELRLGLQEALVNAAKHGNQLDPSKTILVRFTNEKDTYWWKIADQGNGFINPCCCQEDDPNQLPSDCSEGGRGLFILYQIFDHVDWNETGTELSLCKRIASRPRSFFGL